MKKKHESDGPDLISLSVFKILRVMKLLMVLICFIGLLSSFGKSYSQNTKLSVEFKNSSIESVLNYIESHTEYSFMYDNKKIDISHEVSINVKNQTIKSILDQLFENGVNYQVIDKHIIITPKESQLSTSTQQQKSISGKVTDPSDALLPGVSVVVKGTTIGTITDADGKYSLNNVTSDAILVFSFVGMKTQEIHVSGKSSINVILIEETVGIDEVVAIGYGTQKKTTLSGSVSTKKGEELAKSTVANISNSLGGKLTGVTAISNGGQPGHDNATIMIRGIGTTGSSSPLIVVDGIVRNSGINQIDPSIIESVSVLKDAAAVAPYGLGGANGVILITTKKGKSGLPTLSFDSYYGVQTPTYYPNLLNAKDYMILSNEAYLNEFPGLTDLPFAPKVIENYDVLHTENPDLYPDSNTRDYVNMTIPIQKQNLQLSGGSDNVNYFAGIEHYKQNGIFDDVSYRRFNYTMKLESKVTRTTQVSLSLIGVIEKTNDIDIAQGTWRLFRSAYKYIPTQPLYYSNGLWGQWAGNSPIGLINSGGYSKLDERSLLSGITIEQQLPFIKGLSIKGNFGYDTYNGFNKGLHKPAYYWEQDSNTIPYTYTKAISNMEGTSPDYIYLRQSQSKANDYTFQGYVNYKRIFGKHEVTGLAVVESKKTVSDQFWAQRNNFTVDIDELDLGSSDKNDYDNGGSSSEGAQMGYVYRIGYVYDNKYIIETSGRYDGHYFFAPDKRWGYFPSFSTGWRLSEEKFMKRYLFINNLKIRASWGKSGNLAGGAYQYLSGYTLTGNSYAFGSGTMVQGAYVEREANPNITWEISTKTDIGIEASLWNSLVKIEADFFYEKRTDMLLAPAITVPIEYGLSLSDENAGEMKNRGIELTIGSTHKFSNGLKLSFDGNLSFAKNKLIQVFETAATYNNLNRRVTGRALGTPFGYHSLGLFSTSDDKNGDGIIDSSDGYNVIQFGDLHPGDIKYADLSGSNGDMIPDGKIDENDMIPIGNPSYPLMVFGATLSAEWKGFDLSLFFQGAGMVASNIGYSFLTVPFLNDKSNCDYEYFNNRWTPEHQDTKYPRSMGSPYANNIQGSDFWMMNTSYIRLKNCTLGYNLPMNITKTLSIKNVRIYFSGQNLFTLSKLGFNDPEIVGDNQTYPNMKLYTLGMNVTF